MNILNIWMILGFLFSTYSIIGNDSLQTLGTFLSTNSHRSWWILWLFTSFILVIVLLIGWFFYGDVSYGRLDYIAFPSPFLWVYILPPLVISLLTYWGIPVSTTFLILTVFSPEAISPMLTKSILGYGLAFGLAFLVYQFVLTRFETEESILGKSDGLFWTVLQWSATALLWSQWLIQDLANIYVYLPRDINLIELLISLLLMIFLQAIFFSQKGGKIQSILNSKSNTKNIRSATILDFIYGFVLLLLVQQSKIPLSTTWVFLGLLAGRELSISLTTSKISLKETGRMILSDLGKASIGLVVSIILALGLPHLAF